MRFTGVHNDKCFSSVSHFQRLAGSVSLSVSYSPEWDTKNVWPWSWWPAPVSSEDWTHRRKCCQLLFLKQSPPTSFKLRNYQLSFLRIRKFWNDKRVYFFVTSCFLIFVFFTPLFFLVEQMEKISSRIPVRKIK